MPTAAHLIYIPGVLLVGIAVGFVMGARSARDELQRKARERKR